MRWRAAATADRIMHLTWWLAAPFIILNGAGNLLAGVLGDNPVRLARGIWLVLLGCVGLYVQNWFLRGAERARQVHEFDEIARRLES